ncbi:MAG: CYTH domain-containing protein [Patescibacteria group bacterium]|nr:CYTH domain-containing protein [Patescibacteria group bacterium]
MKLFRRGGNPEQTVNPEPTELKNLEQETRLPDLPPNFEQQLLENGAKLLVPKRLIQDTRYNGTAETLLAFHPELEIPQDSLAPETRHDDLVAALTYAGFKATAPGYETVFYVSQYQKPGYEMLVRMRQENRNPVWFIFTVKGPKTQVREIIKERPEYEALFIDPKAIREVLERTGFSVSSYFEKQRTTLEFMGCKVEIDVCPVPQIDPWGEIEGNQVQIQKALKEIQRITGYQGRPIAIGQREFFKQELNRLKIKGVDPNNVRFGEQS